MQAGSFGFNLLLTTKLDLATTESMHVIILRPDGSYVEKDLLPAAFTAPAQGATQPIWTVSVPIVVGDLSIAGTYRIQLLDSTAGRSLPSAVGSFNVLPNIK